MLKRFRSFLKGRQALKEIAAREERITAAVATHRFGVEKLLADLKIETVYDGMQNRGTLLIYEPQSRVVRLQSQIDSYDRHMALTMLFMHLGVTCRGRNITKIAPYLIYQEDLHAPEGPYHNEQWGEYMLALEAAIPWDSYTQVAALFPENPTYALIRVLQVDYETLGKRNRQFMAQLQGEQSYPFEYLHPTKQAQGA